MIVLQGISPPAQSSVQCLPLIRHTCARHFFDGWRAANAAYWSSANSKISSSPTTVKIDRVATGKLQKMRRWPQSARSLRSRNSDDMLAEVIMSTFVKSITKSQSPRSRTMSMTVLISPLIRGSRGRSTSTIRSDQFCNPIFFFS